MDLLEFSRRQPAKKQAITFPLVIKFPANVRIAVPADTWHHDQAGQLIVTFRDIDDLRNCVEVSKIIRQEPPPPPDQLHQAELIPSERTNYSE